MMLSRACFLIFLYFISLVEGMQQKNRRGLRKPLQNRRSARAYYYDADADYSLSNNGNYRVDAHNYATLHDTHGQVLDSDFEDFSSFSDADFSEAISKLTGNELDKLERLLDEEEGESNHLAKRETNDDKFSRAQIAEDSDQIASFRSWFSKGKTTKTTKKPFTTKSTRKKSYSPRRRPSRRTKATPVSKLFSDNNDITRYGQNSEAKNAIDRNVLARINKIKRSVYKRTDESIDSQTGSRRNKRELGQTDKKLQPDNSEGAGSLQDSFPDPNKGTASFHTPLERLVRVKRQSA